LAPIIIIKIWVAFHLNLKSKTPFNRKSQDLTLILQPRGL